MQQQRRKSIHLAVLAITAGGALAGQAAHAQQSAPATERRALETVVVTAQKREESVQDVPAAISVLSGDRLLDAGIGRSAAEILSYVPNASAGTQQHGRPRWWIRGVGTGVQSLDSPNPVGIYLDDVYISNASATGFPLFDLDRVEVLRGPQGTLWGKNTTGGAVNFISRRPGLSPDGYLKLDYGRHDNKTVEGAFGGPLLGDRIAARVSFHYESRDGIYDNAYTGEDDGALQDSVFRVQLLGNLTDNLEAHFSAHFRDYDVDGATASTTGTGVGGAYRNGYIPPRGVDRVSTNAPSESSTSQNGALLNLKWQLGELELTSITAYEDFSNDAIADSDNTPLEIGRGYTDAESEQYSQELRLASPKENRLSWVAGLHYLKENIDSTGATAKLPGVGIAVPTPADSWSLTTYSHDTRSIALFGSVTFNVTDRFDITTGLRWTSEEKALDFQRLASTGAVAFSDTAAWWRPSSVSSPIIANVLSRQDESWNDWSWDITPQYAISDNTRVYARLAKGFRSGGFNTGATSQAAIDQVVDPEYLTSLELGFKSEWLDGRLNANVAVFGYLYEDIQVNVVGPLPTSNGVAVSYLQNVEEGEAKGVEIDIEALPIDNLRISASLGWLDTEFTKFAVPGTDGGVLDYAGGTFVRSPEYSAVIGIDYELPLVSGASLTFGTDWKWQDDQAYFTTNQDNPLLGAKAYALGNARIAYATAGEAVTLTAYVKNVTDEEYHNHALPGTAGATGATTIWGEARTYGVSLVARW